MSDHKYPVGAVLMIRNVAIANPAAACLDGNLCTVLEQSGYDDSLGPRYYLRLHNPGLWGNGDIFLYDHHLMPPDPGIAALYGFDMKESDNGT